jgi:hypothetical protein
MTDTVHIDESSQNKILSQLQKLQDEAELLDKNSPEFLNLAIKAFKLINSFPES